MAPKSSGSTTRKKTTSKALPKSRQKQKAPRPKKGGSTTASGQPIAGQLGHRSEIPNILAENIQLVSELFPAVSLLQNEEDGRHPLSYDGSGPQSSFLDSSLSTSPGPSNAERLLHYYGPGSGGESSSSAVTGTDQYIEGLPHYRGLSFGGESTLSAAADQFTAEQQYSREQNMIPLSSSTAGVPDFLDLESLWYSNDMANSSNEIYRGTSSIGLPPIGGPDGMDFYYLDPPSPHLPNARLDGDVAPSGSSQQPTGLPPIGEANSAYEYSLGQPPTLPMHTRFDDHTAPVGYSQQPAGLPLSRGFDGMYTPPTDMRIDRYLPPAGPIRRTASLPRYNSSLPPGASMPLRGQERFHGEVLSVITSRPRLFRVTGKKICTSELSLATSRPSHAPPPPSPLSGSSSAIPSSSTPPTPNDLDKATRKQVRWIFIVKALLNRPIATLRCTDGYINEALREVLNEPPTTASRPSQTLTQTRSHISTMCSTLKRGVNKYIRTGDQFTADFPFPPLSPADSSGLVRDLSTDKGRREALAGASGTDFVHVYGPNGHIKWFALPVLREFIYETILKAGVIVPEEYIPQLGQKASKGIIGLYTIILAHAIRVHLHTENISSSFKADDYLGEFDRLYQQMEAIEDEKEGCQARDDFEVLKEDIFRQQL